MELSEEQRRRLRLISLRQYELENPDLAGKGRDAIEARKRKRDKLDRLRKAWGSLNSETQQDVIAHVIAQWEEYDPNEAEADGKSLSKPLPDLGRIAHLLEKAISRPENAPEDHPGLTDAVKFLWSAWCPQQLGGHVSIEPAVAPIAAEIAVLFTLGEIEATRRVRDRLHTLSESGKIERRPKSKKGRRLTPFA